MTHHLPLAVDLDETLLLTDTLAEGVVNAALHKPFKMLSVLPTITKGKPTFKRAVFALAELDYDALPARSDLIEYLREQRDSGREIVLVTATSRDVAEKVAARFGDLFTAVHGTTEAINLKGRNKAAFLTEAYPDGFVYAGDSRADLNVWKKADGIIFAGAAKGTRSQANSFGVPIEASFENTGGGLRSWRKALRLHQWAKNLLLFVALMLSGSYQSVDAWAGAIVGFIFLGVAASGTYLINDLVDLSADRRHRTKSARPFASGRLNPFIGLLVAPALVLSALLGGFVLNPAYGIGLLCYLVVTMSYSFGLKKVAMLDVFILASLFTIRLALGAFAISVILSEWLMTFSMFFFLSLSLAKRHVEVNAGNGDSRIRGRGYYSSDAPLTLNFGISAGAAAILIMVLYLAEEAFPSGQYSLPGALWAVPLLITLWLMRIWTLAHRGQLDDDPVAFAVKDRPSLVLGACLAVAFALAIMI